VAPTSDCSNLEFIENLSELVGASTNGEFKEIPKSPLDDAPTSCPAFLEDSKRLQPLVGATGKSFVR